VIQCLQVDSIISFVGRYLGGGGGGNITYFASSYKCYNSCSGSYFICARLLTFNETI